MLILPPVATLRHLELNLGGNVTLIGGYKSLPLKAKAKLDQAVADGYKVGEAGERPTTTSRKD